MTTPGPRGPDINGNKGVFNSAPEEALPPDLI